MKGRQYSTGANAKAKMDTFSRTKDTKKKAKKYQNGKKANSRTR